jgi:hypothetical protein
MIGVMTTQVCSALKACQAHVVVCNADLFDSCFRFY